MAAVASFAAALNAIKPTVKQFQALSYPRLYFKTQNVFVSDPDFLRDCANPQT